MKNIYKEMYNNNKILNLRKNSRIGVMLDVVNNINPKNKNILDIGCYDGVFLSTIKGGNNLFGIEASDYGFKESSKKDINVKQFFFNDKDKFPFENNFFDIIVAGEIIEHIYDTDFFLEEVYRMLSPGGKFLISTPNIASFGRRLMLFTGVNPIIELSPNECNSSGHIRYFTFKTLKNLLKKHNFKIILIKSDIVNFSRDGKIRSFLMPKLFPTIGQSVICLCQK